MTTLLNIMLDQSAPPACKVRAAVCVLERTNKAIQTEDFEARIAALDAARTLSRSRNDWRTRCELFQSACRTWKRK